MLTAFSTVSEEEEENVVSVEKVSAGEKWLPVNACDVEVMFDGKVSKGTGKGMFLCCYASFCCCLCYLLSFCFFFSGVCEHSSACDEKSTGTCHVTRIQ